MRGVTTKFLVTLPKATADKYQIHDGDEVEATESGDQIHVIPAKVLPRMSGTQERLRLFDDATARQREREAETPRNAVEDRGWTREEIYDRGRAD